MSKKEIKELTILGHQATEKKGRTNGKNHLYMVSLIKRKGNIFQYKHSTKKKKKQQFSTLIDPNVCLANVFADYDDASQISLIKNKKKPNFAIQVDPK